LIGPGGQATDQPSTKPVASKGRRETVMAKLENSRLSR